MTTSDPRIHHVSIRPIPHYHGYAEIRIEAVDDDKQPAAIAMAPYGKALDLAAQVSAGVLAIVDHRR